MARPGSSLVKTLNYTSFHMWRMVRVEVEISASVGGSPVDFGDQCRLYPDDENIQKRNRPKLLRWLRKFCNRSGPQSQQWFVLCRVKSQFLKMLHVDVANDRCWLGLLHTNFHLFFQLSSTSMHDFSQFLLHIFLLSPFDTA
jgi:hypothetical protein